MAGARNFHTLVEAILPLFIYHQMAGSSNSGSSNSGSGSGGSSEELTDRLTRLVRLKFYILYLSLSLILALTITLTLALALTLTLALTLSPFS